MVVSVRIVYYGEAPKGTVRIPRDMWPTGIPRTAWGIADGELMLLTDMRDRTKERKRICFII